MFKNISKILLAPLLVFFIHIIFMFFVKIYVWWPPTDMPMHFLGGASIAIAALVGLSMFKKQRKIPPLPLWLTLVIALGLTFTAAVVWEYYEFLQDYFLHTHAQESLNDTMSDLFFGGLGGLIVVGTYWLKKKR